MIGLILGLPHYHLMVGSAKWSDLTFDYFFGDCYCTVWVAVVFSGYSVGEA